MGLTPGMALTDIAVDRVFIGSCTNGRIEDLRAAAKIVQGQKVASTVRAMVVPGSGLVKQQAEAEGLDAVFTAAGFEWREPGCSMCLAMNPDKLEGRQLCASSSNRNFKGRQGSPTGRTLLTGSGTTFATTTRRATNTLRTDFLFSYRPSPGTVVFAGYGDTMTEPSPLAFNQLRRTADAFFLKASYVFEPLR